MTNTGQPSFREIRYDVAGGTATMTLHKPSAQRLHPYDGGGIVSLRIAASRKPVIVAVNEPPRSGSAPP